MLVVNNSFPGCNQINCGTVPVCATTESGECSITCGTGTYTGSTYCQYCMDHCNSCESETSCTECEYLYKLNDTNVCILDVQKYALEVISQQLRDDTGEECATPIIGEENDDSCMYISAYEGSVTSLFGPKSCYTT